MWKCLKCGKVNNGGFCGVCGSPKPLENYQNNQQNNMQNIRRNNQQSVGNVQGGNNYRNTGVMPVEKRKKKKTGLIIFSTLLIIILVITGTVAFVILNDNKKDAKTEENIKTSQQEEQKEPTDPEEPEEPENPINPEKPEEPEDPINTEKTEEPEDPIEPEEPIAPKGEGDGNVELYDVYKNTTYNFECAYPTDFVNVAPKGINAVKTLQSEDGTAVMTIRACENSDGINIAGAMKDYYNVYGKDVTYQASGDTWYVFAREKGNKSYYRKCFIKNGNIYCMDFEFNTEDMDIYSPCIEYIEDNFKTM